MRTIFGLFRTYSDADAAVQQLEEMEYTPAEMNAVIQAQAAKGYMNVNQQTAHVEVTDKLGEQTLHGLDQLLAREQPLKTNELGPIYAAGDLATIITKGATGATTGGIKTALTELGVPESTVGKYEQGLRNGELLFWLRTDDDRIGVAANVLRQQNATHLITYP